MQPKLIASFKAALAEFNPPAPGATTATPLVSNPGFSKIINPLHFDRVAKLIEGTKGKVVIGGTKSVESGKIEVTVVSDVLVDDVLMQGAFLKFSGFGEGRLMRFSQARSLDRCFLLWSWRPRRRLSSSSTRATTLWLSTSLRKRPPTATTVRSLFLFLPTPR